MEPTTFDIREKWMVHNAILGLLAASAEIKDGPMLYVQAVVLDIIIGVMVGYFSGPRLESLTKPSRQLLESHMKEAIDAIRRILGALRAD